MSDAPSADLLARHLANDAAASEEIFHRYADRLIRLARSRLSRQFAARVDPEDVVLSAYRSFFTLAQSGEIRVDDHGDLWRLLVRITLRKMSHNIRRHRAHCRNVAREEPWPEWHEDQNENALLAREPGPAEAATLADELRFLLAPLAPVTRKIAELRLLGHEIGVIAGLVQRTPRTVRRALAGLGAELRRRQTEADSSQATPLSSEKMIAFADILLRKQLGQGGMGKVYQALLRRSENACRGQDSSETAPPLWDRPVRDFWKKHVC